MTKPRFGITEAFFEWYRKVSGGRTLVNSPDIHAADQHYANYAEYNKALRTWFVSFGLGALVLFMLHPDFVELLDLTGNFHWVLGCFLIGCAIQVLIALINKFAAWHNYWAQQNGFAPGVLYEKLSAWFWIDEGADLATAGMFAYAIVLMVQSFLFNQHYVGSAANMFVAFKAAYTSPVPYREMVDHDDGRVDLQFRPEALLTVSPGIFALVAVGAGENCGRMCSGHLDIFYLRKRNEGFELLGSWRDIGGMSQFGGAPSWAIRNDLFDDPALVVRGANGGGGCGISTGRIVELAPLSPKTVVRDILLSSTGEGGALRSEILSVVRNNAIDVRYTGTRSAVVHYIRQGEEFIANGVQPQPTC